MREALGNAAVVQFVITFIVLFIFFFVGSLSYTKAFKVKNSIINSIEKYGAYDDSLNSEVKQEINANLKQMGYQVHPGKANCKVRNGVSAMTDQANDYRYCVYEYKTSRGTYYGVTAYMYFQIPLIGVHVEIPIHGESKIIGLFGEEPSYKKS